MNYALKTRTMAVDTMCFLYTEAICNAVWREKKQKKSNIKMCFIHFSSTNLLHLFMNNNVVYLSRHVKWLKYAFKSVECVKQKHICIINNLFYSNKIGKYLLFRLILFCIIKKIILGFVVVSLLHFDRQSRKSNKTRKHATKYTVANCMRIACVDPVL